MPSQEKSATEHISFGRRVACGGIGLALAAGSVLGMAGTAFADTPSFNPVMKPAGALDCSRNLTGAATRAAGPSIEILGINGVEESGQFVDPDDWYNWAQPKYAIIASAYNRKMSPYLANLAINAPESGVAKQAVYGDARDGGGAGPDAALLPYGEETESGASDDAIWDLEPKVIVGTGNLGGTAADPTSYYDGLTPGYTAYGVPYSFDKLSNMCNTMDAIADTAAAATAEYGVNGRYTDIGGTPQQIAAQYRTYVEGTIGAVQGAIKEGKVPTRTVALVTGVNVVNDQVVFTLGQSNNPDGTASTNRYLEATSGSGIATNLGDDEDYTTATISDLQNNADLILVGGQQGSSDFSSIISALDAAQLLGKTYFTNNNNATAGAMYGVVMNSVENAQNLGRILGLLYPEVIDQQAWLAYYYQSFYHIDPSLDYLATVMQNALNGQVRNGTRSVPSGGSTEEHIQALTTWNVNDPYNGMDFDAVQSVLDAGQDAYQPPASSQEG